MIVLPILIVRSKKLFHLRVTNINIQLRLELEFPTKNSTVKEMALLMCALVTCMYLSLECYVFFIFLLFYDTVILDKYLWLLLTLRFIHYGLI